MGNQAKGLAAVVLYTTLAAMGFAGLLLHGTQAAWQAPEVASAPAQLFWQAAIAGPEEPGERLIISGQVFAPDGKIPVAGIVVYAYQTDATGQYTKTGALRPPRLQAWARTDGEGRFEFQTIRPAPYPGRTIPAHVHFILWGAGYPRQWVNELRFEGDPYVTSAMIKEAAAAGKFTAVVPLERVADGSLRCAVSFRVQTVSNINN